MSEEKGEPRGGGAYVPKFTQDAIQEAGDLAGNSKTAPPSLYPSKEPLTVSKVISSLKSAVEEKLEPKYGGAYKAKAMDTVDPKATVDKLCHEKCPHVWELYEKCEARIEQKVRLLTPLSSNLP